MSSFQQPQNSSLEHQHNNTLVDRFSHFSQLFKRVTESYSQAETIVSQVGMLTRKTTTSQQTDNNSNINNNIDSLLQQFTTLTTQTIPTLCEECKQSPLWAGSRSMSFEQLQSLSPLQRQRLDAMRGELGDIMDRQLRVLCNRHELNVKKLMTRQQFMSTSNGNTSNSTTPNHVQNVINNQNQNGGSKYTYYQQPNNNNNQNGENEEEVMKRNERESIKRVSTGVRQMVSESNAVLGALRQQRARMTDTDSRLSNVLSSVGVAQSVVRQLEKMTVMDKAIVFGGIAALSLLMFYLWFFVE